MVTLTGTKLPLGREDLLIGGGPVTQIRGGVPVTVTPITFDSINEEAVRTAVAEVLSDYVTTEEAQALVNGLDIPSDITSASLEGNQLTFNKADGTSLPAITIPVSTETTDNITAAAVADNTLTLTKQSGATITADLSSITAQGDSVVSASVENNTLTLTKSSDTTITVDLPASNDIVSASFSVATLTLTKADDSVITVALVRVSSMTYENGTLTLSSSDNSTLTADIPAGVSVTGVTLSGSTLSLALSEGDALTVDLSPIIGSAVTGVSIDSSTLTFTQANGSTIDINIPSSGSTISRHIDPDVVALTNTPLPDTAIPPVTVTNGNDDTSTVNLEIEHEGTLSFNVITQLLNQSGFQPSATVTITDKELVILAPTTVDLLGLTFIAVYIEQPGTYTVTFNTTTNGASASLRYTLFETKVIFKGVLHDPIVFLINDEIRKAFPNPSFGFETMEELMAFKAQVEDLQSRVGGVELEASQVNARLVEKGPVLDLLTRSDTDDVIYDFEPWFVGLNLSDGLVDHTLSAFFSARNNHIISYGRYIHNIGEPRVILAVNDATENSLLIRTNGSNTEFVKTTRAPATTNTITEQATDGVGRTSWDLRFGHAVAGGDLVGENATFSFARNLPPLHGGNIVVSLTPVINENEIDIKFTIPTGAKDNTGTGTYNVIDGATVNVEPTSLNGWERSLVFDGYNTGIVIGIKWLTDTVLEISTRNNNPTNRAVDGGHLSVNSATWTREEAVAERTIENVVATKVGDVSLSLIKTDYATWHYDFGGIQGTIDFLDNTNGAPVGVDPGEVNSDGELEGDALWIFYGHSDFTFYVRFVTLVITEALLTERAERLRLNAGDAFGGQRGARTAHHTTMSVGAQLTALDTVGNIFTISGTPIRDVYDKGFFLEINAALTNSATDVDEDNKLLVSYADFRSLDWWVLHLDILAGYVEYVNISGTGLTAGMSSPTGFIFTTYDRFDIIVQQQWDKEFKQKRTRDLALSDLSRNFSQ